MTYCIVLTTEAWKVTPVSMQKDKRLWDDQTKTECFYHTPNLKDQGRKKLCQGW